MAAGGESIIINITIFTAKRGKGSRTVGGKGALVRYEKDGRGSQAVDKKRKEGVIELPALPLCMHK